MKSRLLSLPSEIIEHIIHLSSIKPYDEADFLGWCYPEHNYVHLKYIALSCQRLYKLCAPFLWKHKEFILPREYDVKKGEAIQMATDLLSTPTALSSNFVLGDHICSLYRNLTTGPHFDLANSSLMAQLVPNLRALRIDFHPSPRTEHYGLRYFFKHCPHLKELFISHCQDTFDDFAAIYQYKPKLTSLALVDCTIKEDTLKVIIELLHPNLRRFLFRQVLIEPKARVKTNITHLLAISHLDFLHPFHFQNSRATVIHQHIYITAACHLTQLALTDSINCCALEQITQSSPLLEKLAIVIHDYYPEQVARCVMAITSLQKMRVLSIAFRKHYPISREFERFPCHAPSRVWSYFAICMPELKSLYISTSRLLLSSDFIPNLINYHPHLVDIMIYSIAFTTQPPTEVSSNLRDEYLREYESITYTTFEEYQPYLYTRQEAIENNYARIIDDVSDVHLCFIKGYK
ncbi:hypothetical protein G6F46_006672 [Rhizopus delemar]|uniref:F-box domain-containing protein n=3 Tax=Rhizopus TaxID=4842 RepID=I1BW19_RHIO9|nr:hypothetical protein RO3G_05104 [Rhizopus delemar RA 99-880]KAG1458320.1 hypothetical protein G6F55_005420 [Rhizopus delemar]KAG1543259.1 hypothetical protein G6F51_006779 [Rhizopus arrhizus]KAG1497152.1 hypothetical protein G6F54_005958 [Rhizopus delemar]KAG1511043.1 hypothetical protein G6F53_006227 [Rhizopus delemar]|eukprot:EIE80399.1 hypothetical protein RO3G_05104 [Rhizopus delemar RA 99-880]